MFDDFDRGEINGFNSKPIPNSFEKGKKQFC